MFTFLLIVQTLIATALVAVILMQRSEGGGLGVGGSSSGFMTARGAADLLTRSTAILGAMFIGMSIVLAAVAGMSRQEPTVDTSLVGDAEAASPATSAAPAEATGDAAPAGEAGATEEEAPAVPLAQ